MRIHILGGPGSGKTMLAQVLASRLQIPHHDLDQIGWKNGEHWATYISDASAIAEQPDWITEGIYLIWTDPLLCQADTIILLEVAWYVALWRIVRRHITRSLHGTNPYPGLRGLQLLVKLLQFTRHYYVDQVTSDPEVAEAVSRCIAEAAASLPSPQSDALLSRFERCRSQIPLTAAFVRRYLEIFEPKVFRVRSTTDRERLLDLLAGKAGPSVR